MEKVLNKLKDIGELLLLIVIYLFVPQFVGLFFYKVVKLSEVTSLYIGNICVAIIYLIKYRDMFKESIKKYFSNIAKNF